MTKPYSELRAEARAALSGKWMMAALVTLIYVVIYGGLSNIPYVGFILTLLVGIPVAYGFMVLFLDVFRGTGAVELEKLFAGFKDYGRIMGTMVLMVV